MNLRQLEMALVDTSATFCIGVLGGAAAKSFPEHWQKVATILASGAVKGLYLSPSLSSYWGGAAEQGVCRKAIDFGCRFALPTLSYCAGLCVGVAVETLRLRHP